MREFQFGQSGLNVGMDFRQPPDRLAVKSWGWSEAAIAIYSCGCKADEVMWPQCHKVGGLSRRGRGGAKGGRGGRDGKSGMIGQSSGGCAVCGVQCAVCSVQCVVRLACATGNINGFLS